jgi:hypothetical protein
MKSETTRIVAQPIRGWTRSPAGWSAALIIDAGALVLVLERLQNDDGVTSVQPRSAYNQVHETRS